MGSPAGLVGPGRSAYPDAVAEHPIVVDPHDPVVERIRAIALELPEATEKISWGRPAFLAGPKRIFALVGSMARPHSVVVKLEPEAREARLQDARFFLPPYWGPSGWVGMDLDDPGVEWDEVAELVEESYRQVALVRQLTALDADRAVGGQGGG